MNKSTVTQFVYEALKEVGTTESPAGSNHVKFWDETDPSYQGQPWCAAFVSAIAKRVGQDDIGQYYYCPTFVEHFKKLGKWKTRDSEPQPGWIIFFAGSDGIACHVGIVQYKGSILIKTIEGNTSLSSNDNGGAVMQRKRALGSVGSSFYVLGYGVPEFISPGIGKYTTNTRIRMFKQPTSQSAFVRSDPKNTNVNITKLKMATSGNLWAKRKRYWFKVQDRTGVCKVKL